MLDGAHADDDRRALGAGGSNALHPMQQAFREHHGLQCGFCTPGMVMTAVALARKSDLTEAEVRHGLEGNICRCTGYQNIVHRCWPARPPCTRRKRRVTMSNVIGIGAAPRARKTPLSDRPRQLRRRHQAAGHGVGVFIRSPHGHAVMRGIDKTPALALPGVSAVLTGDDVAPTARLAACGWGITAPRRCR
jgi:hypothetical protein